MNWLRSLTPEIEKTLKPSNYDAKTWFLHFTAQKYKCPRRFWEFRHWNFAHVFNVPVPSLLRFYLFIYLFFAENVGFRKTQISPKNTKPQKIGGKNETKKPIR